MIRFAVNILIPLAIVGAALWYATSASGTQQAQTSTIQVTAVTHRAVLVFPPSGRLGDAEQLHWSINDRFGHHIGHGKINCRWRFVQARLCNGVIKFPLGTVAVYGVSETRSLGEWAVLSGTGRYFGARGQLIFRAIGVQRLVLVIHI